MQYVLRNLLQGLTPLAVRRTSTRGWWPSLAATLVVGAAVQGLVGLGLGLVAAPVTGCSSRT